MQRAALAIALLICVAAVTASAQAPQQKPAGLDAEWDIAVILGEISAHAGRLLPALDRIDAQAWVAKGAPDAYAAQLESARQQAQAVQNAAKALAADPERLAAGLELFFRIQGIDEMIASVSQGIRKYQSGADAEALIALAAENGTNRDRFREYLVNLAADREKQLEIMDREAQRCGAELAAPSASPKPATKKQD
jgi:hypothetical protein